MSRAIRIVNRLVKYTIDILPNNKKIYWNSISDIDGKNKTRAFAKMNEYTNRIIFHSGDSINVLKKLYLKRVNFAFLDGSHNKKN